MMNKRVFTSGRPPWYDATGSIKEPLVIGVAGGSASGKTSVCQKIIEALDVKWVVLLSQDSFYKGLNAEQRANASEYNFDHPDAFDFDLLKETIRDLKHGKHVQIPVYDFKIHGRQNHSKAVYGADVIIYEGILALYWKDLRALMDMKIFVDTDDDIRLARRLKRDIAERGRDVQGVIQQYSKFVKPAFDDYIQPSKKYADIIIPRGLENQVAIDLITQHIRTKLYERGFVSTPLLTVPSNLPKPPQVHVLEPSPRLSSMHTILRNQDTCRSDFVFYSDRLVSLVLEETLALLPYKDKVVETPTGTNYKGYEFGCKICAVSILRGGSVMEAPLRAICKGIRIGKILIQSDKDHKPHLYYTKIPKDVSLFFLFPFLTFSSLIITSIAERHVFSLDPTMASGAAAQMAVRVLLDHKVPEENIHFVTVIAAPRGLRYMTYFFPKLHIVSSAIDTELNDSGFIVPGIGNYADRYFGTDERNADVESDLDKTSPRNE